ncbi:HAD family hydrolase [Thermodesulforhabdus norvegica]|uniref:phosphoglycolate phosphatase n=1 Tax=Thermodesulforhabdus norvegica TaxID=39841 RepID=A0A1I4VKU1_9BACT|nr:HAD family hydrolase [Thermodesulforhabdus norvegica]SFN01787.1 haloacid dehalogenase superfamily, subfamily IA, variant 3 with third motif having DD or ED/haloacid dehalogenase superfamily, subfamily IA, variant 1 with third motif having Dx(3-4)D or Dx(3-4)E [Thermodesulforhabdus norvegica]
MRGGVFSSVKVVVFDCDGVLFDSREANIRYYNYILERFGYPPVSPEQVEYVHTHSVKESIFYLIKDPDKAGQALEYARRVDFSLFFPYMDLHDGAKACLKALKTYRYGLAVATNRTASTRGVLAHFGIDCFFDYIICAADVKNPKPHPEMLERILSYFKVPADAVIYVGDSAVDQECARKAGVLFVSFKNPDLDADVHVGGFQDLLFLLTPVSA